MKKTEIPAGSRQDTSETVILIASGYEWICPECDEFNTEIESNVRVTCPECGESFTTEPPLHAHG